MSVHITDEMLRDCYDNPVRSQDHDFYPNQQDEYNLLSAGGRTLYDNLRTKYGVEHIQAYVWSIDLHGRKRKVSF